jgi:hypothetical protein
MDLRVGRKTLYPYLYPQHGGAGCAVANDAAILAATLHLTADSSFGRIIYAYGSHTCSTRVVLMVLHDRNRSLRASAWSEQAYDAMLRGVEESDAIEARVNAVRAELYFARSKQGQKQVISHRIATMLILAIGVRMKRAVAGGGAAS